MTTIAEATAFQGPIPPPDALERYEQIHPGAANRLLALTENEAAHRREIEQQIVAAQVTDSVADRRQRGTGQWMAFVIAMTAIIGGVWAALKGAELAGGIISTIGIGSVVLAFLRSHKHQDPRNGKSN